ncbi:hypothetical protein K2173_002553 [Erythroxylum novogranatense]|uniref:Nuclear matrix constituent protein 1-like protein n=1 Tax=Erythroxylum novogranatense TaxID=1862640 RepID=A0AAV8TTW4_9ROSI|nr:hypothetical protein K2173_002553 [Erythroxylum novogranatense]
MASPMMHRALSLKPGAKVLRTPLTDESIWKRLKEAGFDEESIKRRDKAALISYIAKLEAEIYDLQNHMGVLILERKELASKHEQIRTSAEATELLYKRDQAAHLSSLAEAKKREDGLRKALGVDKECIASMEKALHEMRAEVAENKVTAECKLAEAHKMVEDAQKKFIEADSKLHAAEALQAEASRHHRAAERTLQEVEAHENDLRRQISEFRSDCDAKEREISLERQSLSERRRVLQQEHDRLLDGQALLNQQEEYVASKTEELKKLERELEAKRKNIEQEFRSLNEEKLKMDLTGASFSQREEVVIHKECLLNKREQELLVLQGKLENKEFVEMQKVIANQEAVLRTKRLEFESELEMRRKLVEDEIEAKRRAWELREIDLHQREDLLLEKEHDLEVLSRALEDKEKDVKEKMNNLVDKERRLSVAQEDHESMRSLLEHEKEENNKMKLELQKSLAALDDKRKQVNCAKEKLETMKSETDELSALEMKLKEEVDVVRTQKLDLMAEEDRLKVEKAKFEAEWELIDEKREELRKQAEHVDKEREAISRLLRDERENLKQEKEAMRHQHKCGVESFNRDREEFMNKMRRSEHEDFLMGIEMQKKELENSVDKRREEVESYLRDEERAFKIEKSNELHLVNSLREKAFQELEQVALEMKKLGNARMEVNFEREQRDREWSVLNKSIEELKDQTEKLEKQRELLRVEREEVGAQVEYLNKLEDLKLALDNMEVAEMQLSNIEASQRKLLSMKSLKHNTSLNQDTCLISDERMCFGSNVGGPDLHLNQKSSVTSSFNSARPSWIKRCTNLIFKNSSEKSTGDGKSLIPELVKVAKSADNLDSSNGYRLHKSKSSEDFGKREQRVFSEPKVTLEMPQEDEIAEGHGRKRRVDSDSVSSLPEQQKKNKKRMPLKKVTVDSSDVAIDNRTQESMLDDQIRQKETKRDAEDTNVLVVDKFIKIPEACDITELQNVSGQGVPEFHQPSEQVPIEDITDDGETNGNATSRNVENYVSRCHFGVSGMEPSKVSEEVLQKSVEHTSGYSQSQKDELNKAIEDPDGPVGKVVDNVGARTRSKQKL